MTDVQLNGKPLAEIAPEAYKYFEAANTTLSIGIASLINSVTKVYEEQIKDLRKQLSTLGEANDRLRGEVARAEEHLFVAMSKLARPKNKRVKPSAKGLDKVTEELLEEAFPKSKSEARRLAVMKEAKSGK